MSASVGRKAEASVAIDGGDENGHFKSSTGVLTTQAVHPAIHPASCMTVILKPKKTFLLQLAPFTQSLISGGLSAAYSVTW